MVDKQSDFLRKISQFIINAHDIGFKLTAAEFGRPPELAQLYAAAGKGIKNSLHIQRLAADINAFKDGEYLDGLKPSHIPLLTQLGKLWESMDARARWGGRFLDAAGRPSPDYNHYSFEHNGVK